MNSQSARVSRISSREAIHAEARAAWDHNARFWDRKMGDGNTFFRHLLEPSMLRLLGLQKAWNVLEIACGNGVLSRSLAKRCKTVLATDFSKGMLARARARSERRGLSFQLLDATDADRIAALGESRFDAAACCMALMDISTLRPLFRGLKHVLRPGGHFVFSVLHPCFNSSGVTRVVEEDDFDGGLRRLGSVRVRRYSSIGPEKVVGMPGQPRAHTTFQRTLSSLLEECFAEGFTLDGLAEPTFEPGIDAGLLDWEALPEIPPVLVARVRPKPGRGSR